MIVLSVLGWRFLVHAECNVLVLDLLQLRHLMADARLIIALHVQHGLLRLKEHHLLLHHVYLHLDRVWIHRVKHLRLNRPVSLRLAVVDGLEAGVLVRFAYLLDRRFHVPGAELSKDTLSGRLPPCIAIARVYIPEAIGETR